jgi:predicted ATP-grasp superfamily ATP-dependent carboligase
MKKVLVLDANQRSALAVTRSLGSKGIEVYTAEEHLSALAGFSKYSKQHLTYPSPRLEPKKFIVTLASLIKQNNITVLLPMTELTTMLSLENKATLNVTIPFPDITTVDSLANKYLLMQTATSLNIPIPKTIYVDEVNNLSCDLDQLLYPIVLKPGKSWLYHDNQWLRATVRFANNATEAKNILDTDWAFTAHSFMIQECLDGHGAGIFAIYDRGHPLAFFAHRRLREKPPSGGVSVLSESIAVDPELEQQARTLLDNANWHGVAMVEFKITEDGTPYLMEINTRFWGSLQLAIDAGVDFPHLLYNLACGNKPTPVIRYKTGVKLRWLLGDLDNLYLILRNKQVSLSTKARSVIRFITPSPFSTRHEVNRISDMKPFWFELKQYVSDIFEPTSNT